MRFGISIIRGERVPTEGTRKGSLLRKWPIEYHGGGEQRRAANRWEEVEATRSVMFSYDGGHYIWGWRKFWGKIIRKQPKTRSLSQDLVNKQQLIRRSKMANNLNHRSMLVTFTRRVWQAATTDSDLAHEIERTTGSANGSMKVVKKLVPEEFLKPIQRVAEIAYQEHQRMTVPGFVRGQNLLATAMMERYSAVHFELKNRFDRYVEEFVGLYPKLVETAPQRFKGMAYDASDFPHPSSIPGYFEYKIFFSPVPEVEDWRIEGLQDDDMERLRKEADDRIVMMYDKATEEVFERAKKTLTNVADQAERYEGGPGANLLRDATVEALKEMAELVCLMNVTGNQTLKKVGEEMVANFSTLSGPELRAKDGGKMRQDLATTAKAILAMMGK
jgi:hypothetical protein